MWQIRMHMAFAIKHRLQNPTSGTVRFLLQACFFSCKMRLIIAASQVVEKIKCDKAQLFCLAHGKCSVAIITPICFSPSGCQSPLICALPRLVPLPSVFCIFTFTPLFTETDSSVFASSERRAFHQIYYIFPCIHSTVTLLGFQKYLILSLPLSRSYSSGGNCSCFSIYQCMINTMKKV